MHLIEKCLNYYLDEENELIKFDENFYYNIKSFILFCKKKTFNFDLNYSLKNVAKS